MTQSLLASLGELLSKHSQEVTARAIQPSDQLIDLGVDSLALLSLVVDMETTFGLSIDDADLDGARTVGDLESLIGRLREGV